MAVDPWPPVLGRTCRADGYIAPLRWLINQPATELERRIGYGKGRLTDGWWLLLLIEAVHPGEFEFAGMSYFSGGRIGPPPGGDARPKVDEDLRSLITAKNYDERKAQAVREFMTIGVDRAAKIVPRSKDDGRYPPGSGIPQFRLLQPKTFIVAADVPKGHAYLGGGAGLWIEPKSTHGMGLTS